MKKIVRSAFSWILLASIICGVVGLVIYCINATTGYYVGSSPSITILVLTIAAIVLELVAFFLKDKVKPLRDLFLIIAGACMILSICFFVNERISVAADIWFIPVNYPANEETALYVALVGIVFYILSAVLLIIASIGSNFTKEKEVANKEEVATDGQY